MAWKNLERPIKSRSSIQAGGDVAARGASDRAIKSRSSILDHHLKAGYVVHYYSLANHFKNDLITAVYQKSYNS